MAEDSSSVIPSPVAAMTTDDSAVGNNTTGNEVAATQEGTAAAVAAETEELQLPDLKGLLGALAKFVTASKDITIDNDDDDTALYEELQYAKSFPEFMTAYNNAQSCLYELVGDAILQQQSTDDAERLVIPSMYNDPKIWEDCADACDVLTQHMEVYLQRTDETLCNFANTVRYTGTSALSSIIANTQQNLPKPQLSFASSMPNNSDVTAPFIPKLVTKLNSLVPLDLTLVDYPTIMDDDDDENTAENTTGNEMRRNKRNARLQHCIRPKQYVPHPYKHEVESAECTQLSVPTTKPTHTVVEELVAEWIDTEEGLQALVQTIRSNDTSCIAIDLEAHSYRSFAGIVCLMQLSFKTTNNTGDSSSSSTICNYLIDTLALRSVLQQHLLDLFTDPKIVKVLHGADSDVKWLQRDFGLYIVNLFDTGRASRHLEQRASYAYLLKHYVGIVADKTHQLADWRVRPLSHEMAQYAIQDTHYLLDIYDHLRYDLQTADSIREVLDVSRQVALLRYEPEVFDTRGYQKLLHQGKPSSTTGKVVVTTTNPYSDHVAKVLYEWRDKVARSNDESITYVATNAQLRRILSTASRTRSSGSDAALTVTKLCNLFNPVPSLVQTNATELIQLIQEALRKGEAEHEQDQDTASSSRTNSNPTTTAARSLEIQTGPSSAFFKPSPHQGSGLTSLERKRRGMMSPVLGTEALYREAGWTTPAPVAGEQGIQSSGSEVDSKMKGESGSLKPKKLLSVHTNNKNYKATVPKSHGLDVGTTTNETKAQTQSTSSTSNLSIPAMLGLVAAAPSAGAANFSTTTSSSTGANRIGNTDEDYSEPQEFVIPRSIREIYMISNRNRRNKKTGSPTPERGVTPTSDTDQNEELARAEAVLRQGGTDASVLFDDTRSIGSNTSGGTVGTGGSPGKRPRTKSSGRESEESVPVLDGAVATGGPTVPSTDDDLQFMEEIGWIQDQSEKDTLLEQRYGKRGDSGTATTTTTMGKATALFGGRPGSANSDDASSPAATTVMPNPFFGSTTTTTQRKSTTNTGKNNRQRRSERPEKKGDRSYAYRKR